MPSSHWRWDRESPPAAAGARRSRGALGPGSAQAPVNLVPVANQREDQQHQRNQQQSGSLRRVDRVAMMLVIVLRSAVGHANIVARAECGVGCQVLGPGSTGIAARLRRRPKTQGLAPATL